MAGGEATVGLTLAEVSGERLAWLTVVRVALSVSTAPGVEGAVTVMVAEAEAPGASPPRSQATAPEFCAQLPSALTNVTAAGSVSARVTSLAAVAGLRLVAVRVKLRLPPGAGERVE